MVLGTGSPHRNRLSSKHMCLHRWKYWLNNGYYLPNWHCGEPVDMAWEDRKESRRTSRGEANGDERPSPVPLLHYWCERAWPWRVLLPISVHVEIPRALPWFLKHSSFFQTGVWHSHQKCYYTHTHTLTHIELWNLYLNLFLPPPCPPVSLRQGFSI